MLVIASLVFSIFSLCFSTFCLGYSMGKSKDKTEGHEC